VVALSRSAIADEIWLGCRRKIVHTSFKSIARIERRKCVLIERWEGEKAGFRRVLA
jgi:hypothetical protein